VGALTVFAFPDAEIITMLAIARIIKNSEQIELMNGISFIV